MQKTGRQRGCHRFSSICKEINAPGLVNVKKHKTIQDKRRELRSGAGHGGNMGVLSWERGSPYLT